jgi:hypothetical protein
VVPIGSTVRGAAHSADSAGSADSAESAAAKGAQPMAGRACRPSLSSRSG